MKLTNTILNISLVIILLILISYYFNNINNFTSSGSNHYRNFVSKEQKELDDPTLSLYYDYQPKGNKCYSGENEVTPTPTIIPGANTMKRPGNVYLLEWTNPKTQAITTVKLLTAPSCRMSNLEAAFWNTKREVQGMGELGKMIDFKVELYDYANPINLKYKFPIVVKEIPGN